MDHAGCRAAATRASRSCAGAAGGRSSSFHACSWRAPSAARRSSASASASAHIHPHPTRHGASSRRRCSPWTRPSSRCLSATATPVLPASTYAEYMSTFLCFLAICVKPGTRVFIRRHQGSRSSIFEGFWARLLNEQPLRTRVPAVVVTFHWLDFHSRQGLNHTQTSAGDRVCLHTHIVFCDMSCFCHLNPGSAPMCVVGPTPPPHLPPAFHPSLPFLRPASSVCADSVCFR